MLLQRGLTKWATPKDVSDVFFHEVGHCKMVGAKWFTTEDDKIVGDKGMPAGLRTALSVVYETEPPDQFVRDLNAVVELPNGPHKNSEVAARLYAARIMKPEVIDFYDKKLENMGVSLMAILRDLK